MQYRKLFNRNKNREINQVMSKINKEMDELAEAFYEKDKKYDDMEL